MKKRIKIQGFFIFLAFVASILLSKVLFPNWKKEALDEFLDALGISLVLFGFLFRISGRGYKTEKCQDGKILITDGPYSIMRNPMYFGTLLIGLGIVLVLLQWWTILLFFIIFLIIYIPQMHREEQKLHKQFGNEYTAYCKKTPKYFPRISSLLKLEFRYYLPLKWSWIKKEFISLIGVICGILAVEIWEDIRLFGYKEYIKELLEFFLIIVFFVFIFSLFYEKDIQRKY